MPKIARKSGLQLRSQLRNASTAMKKVTALVTAKPLVLTALLAVIASKDTCFASPFPYAGANSLQGNLVILPLIVRSRDLRKVLSARDAKKVCPLSPLRRAAP